MNEALLAEWWWRFGVERNALWRRIICSKYGLDSSRWLPHASSNSKLSGIWKGILVTGTGDEISSKVLREIYLSTMGLG